MTSFFYKPKNKKSIKEDLENKIKELEERLERLSGELNERSNS